VLTDERAKPAMPYGGVYRLIDFPLSNCMHSGIGDVWIIQQYQPHSLNDHVSNGRPWDLDRTHGGLRLLQPHQGGEQSGWHRGNADAIFRHKSFIEEMNPDLLLVLSSDHVYKLDYSKVVIDHLESDAVVTIVTTSVERDEAGRFGVVEVGDDGRVTGFQYKPDSPSSDLVTTEVFLFDTTTTLALLEEFASEDDDEDEAEEGSDRLKDFGHALLPRLVEDGAAVEHRLDGYWRDLGTVDSYWLGHMELLGAEPKIVLDDPRWPINTLGAQRPPARIHGSARIDDGLVSPGCVVRGLVVRSVLAPGVIVEEGALVRDSVVLHGTTIGEGATIDCAVVDMEVRVDPGGRVGAERPSRAVGDSDIVLLGQRGRVESGARLEPGARVAPGETRSRRD
jgi:glucose-1-phosphate adenylyltransferase